MPQASAGAGRPRAIARKSSAGMARLKTNTPMPRAPPGGSRSHRAKAQPHRTNAKTGMTIPPTGPIIAPRAGRSEEHTSELQSLMRTSYAVFCLKKKKHLYSQLNIILQHNHQNTHT